MGKVAKKLLLALAVAANASSFNAIAQGVAGSTSGVFQNPTGPSGMVVTGVGGSSFSWGNGQPFNSPPSSVTFSGVSFSSAIGAPFVVGAINYFNGTVVLGTEANTVDLALTLKLTNGVTATSIYTLTLITTPNTGDANANADILQFPSVLPTGVFSIDGVDYTLTLDVGSVTGSGFSSQRSFHVREGESATATLMGTFTLIPSVVATGLNQPFGVAAGSIYIAEQNAHKVLKVDPVTLQTTVVAGTGVAGYNGDGISATAAQLNGPSGVTVGPDGSLYIADSGNHAIRKISAPGTPGAVITTIAGVPPNNGIAVNGGPATAALLYEPKDVKYAAGHIYIVDHMNQQVRKVNLSTGIISAVVGSGEVGSIDDLANPCPAPCAASAAKLNGPRAVAIDGNGVLYVADTGNDKIRKVATPAGASSAVVTTVTAGLLGSPTSLAVTADGTKLYIADLNFKRIQRVVFGTSTTDVTTVVGAGLNAPVAVALDETANPDLLYIGDLLDRVLKVGLSP